MSNDMRPLNPKPNEPPEWFGKFLDIQSREVEERAEERKLRAQVETNHFELAKLSLGAQERTYTSDHDSRKHERRDTYFLVAAVILIIAVLVGVAMWLGKDALAMELVKAVLYLTAGGAGGFALGKVKAKKEDGTDE